MSDDLIARLRAFGHRDPSMDEAADALEAARAETERLREELAVNADVAEKVRQSLTVERDRADAAEAAVAARDALLDEALAELDRIDNWLTEDLSYGESSAGDLCKSVRQFRDKWRPAVTELRGGQG